MPRVNSSGIIEKWAPYSGFALAQDAGSAIKGPGRIDLFMGAGPRAATAAGAAGKAVTYEVNGQPYEGYYSSPSAGAPLVLLIHDWDGLTDYEVKRSRMLAELGYAVFAMDLFGAGIRPDKIEDRRQHTGELYKDRARMRQLMLGAVDAARSVRRILDPAQPRPGPDRPDGR